MLNDNVAKARLYREVVGPLKYFRQDKYEKPIGMSIMNLVDVC